MNEPKFKVGDKVYVTGLARDVWTVTKVHEWDDHLGDRRYKCQAPWGTMGTWNESSLYLSLVQ